jgi:TPR repeat protein
MFSYSVFLKNLTTTAASLFLLSPLFSQSAYGMKDEEDDNVPIQQAPLKFIAIEEESNKIDIGQQYLNEGKTYFQNKNFQQALICYERAAELDNPEATEAIFSLGLKYQEGRNYQQASICYEKAAELGNRTAIQAISVLGSIYQKTQDYKKALTYYERAANLGEPMAITAIFSLGLKYQEGRNYQQASICYERAANLGEPMAIKFLTLLGRMYGGGDVVEKSDMKAAHYYEKAAELGDSDAMNRLANLYYEGAEGIKKDVHKAIKLFEKAVNLGHVVAMANLAYVCREMKNFDRAISLYEAARKKQHCPATYSLALMYHYGQGTSKDLKKAQVLYKLAITFAKESSENDSVYKVLCGRRLNKVSKKLDEIKRKKEEREEIARLIRLKQECKKEKEEEEKRNPPQSTNTQKDKQKQQGRSQPGERQNPSTGVYPLTSHLQEKRQESLKEQEEKERRALLKKQEEEEKEQQEKEKKKKEREKRAPSSAMKPEEKAPPQTSSEDSDSSEEAPSNRFETLSPNLQKRIRHIFDVALSRERKGMTISFEYVNTVFEGLDHVNRGGDGDHTNFKSPKNEETGQSKTTTLVIKDQDAGAIQNIVVTLILDGVYPPEMEEQLRDKDAFKYYMEKRAQKKMSATPVNTPTEPLKEQAPQQKKTNKKKNKKKKRN